jgi:hypothetical protein
VGLRPVAQGAALDATSAPVFMASSSLSCADLAQLHKELDTQTGALVASNAVLRDSCALAECCYITYADCCALPVECRGVCIISAFWIRVPRCAITG